MFPNPKDFMGGIFDFNGDGRTDAGEMFIAYKIYEESTSDPDGDRHDEPDAEDE